MARIDPGTNYNRLFFEASHRFPDRVAFRTRTAAGYRETSHAEVWRQASGVALGLLGMGFSAGDRMAILSENRAEWVFAYMGIFIAGGTAVPLDAQISPGEWRRLLDDSESKLVFVSGSLLPRLREAVRDSPLAASIVCLDSMAAAPDARTQLGGLADWGHSLEPAPPLPEVKPSDWSVLIYTSGTTGHPKGVMLTQRNIVAEMAGIFNLVYLDEHDALLCMLPLQHVFASIVNVLTPLAIGGKVVFVDTLKRAEILEALEAGGISVLLTVPQFFYLFYDQIQDELAKRTPVVRRLFQGMLILNRLSRKTLGVNLGKWLFGKVHERFGERLRYFVCGGSSFDPKVIRFFFDMGFTVIQGYGLTETTGAVAATPLDTNVLGSVGRPLLANELRLHEPDAAGVGEVIVRGPLVMKGYYRNPEATAEVLIDGWFHTGDLGRIDAGGNLWITGRRKEVIVLPNGKNIYPDEIEDHYLQCPFIKEIAVLGISAGEGRETSEKLHAVVVPDFDYLKTKRIANAREILRDEIGRWSIQLPKYKRLMSHQIQKDPLPRTTTRKIKRLELKRMIESGELRGMESSQAPKAAAAEDVAMKESAVGQEVLRCLTEDCRRTPVDLHMNLELDLGFDSMERVELLASLEQSLSLRLPEGFGSDIFTVHDLIAGLDQQAIAAGGAGSGPRQSWKTILSEEALRAEGEWHIRFTGATLTLLKYLGLRLIYVMCRIFLRLETRGVGNLPKQGPFLICPNHLSYIDPFVVLSVVPYRVFKNVFFVGASEYFETWYMKLLGKLANIVPVDPDSHLLRAMKIGGFGLRQGRILCIFPEGARSFDGSLKEFKKGAAILSRELGAPIVPVALHGAYEVWARGSLRIRPHKVKLAFGTPFIPDGSRDQDPYQAGTDQLRETVSSLLAQLTG
jgi:long-chain acyl-CoA synthetase